MSEEANTPEGVEVPDVMEVKHTSVDDLVSSTMRETKKPWVKRITAAHLPRPVQRKVNAGSGGKKLDGWTNVDANPFEEPDVCLDLGTATWPFATDSVEEIMCSHLLEHLEGEKFFHFLREAYRVLMPNGIMHVVVPHVRHRVFINDPTHVRAVTPDTVAMFSQDAYRRMAEEQNGWLTPFWRYNRVDFRFFGQVHFALDPSCPKEWIEDGSWRERENYLNNIVVEWHFKVQAVKPFYDKGKPVYKGAGAVADADPGAAAPTGNRRKVQFGEVPKAEGDDAEQS